MKIVVKILQEFRHKIRKILLRESCYSIGKNLIVYSGIRIYSPEHLFIKNNVAINNDVWINASGKVCIGNNVIIGPRVIIHSANHRYYDPDIPIRRQGHIFERVVIEDDVWVGAGAIVLPGVKIGKGSVIAAGSVVTKNVPPFTVVAGVPARKIKERK